MATEYFSHRFVLHRHWKVSQRKYKRFWPKKEQISTQRISAINEKPFDGEHIERIAR